MSISGNGTTGNLTLTGTTPMLQADSITNSAGTGAPSFPNGFGMGTNVVLSTGSNVSVTSSATQVVIASGTAQTLTLPAAASFPGRTITFKKTAATGSVTVSRAGADSIDGAYTSYKLFSQYSYLTFVSDGVSIWYMTSKPLTAILSAYLSAATGAFTSGTTQTLVVDTTVIDQGASLSSNRFTPQNPGKFLVNWQAQLTCSVSGDLAATSSWGIYKNGSISTYLTGFEWNTDNNLRFFGLRGSGIITANGTSDIFDIRGRTDTYSGTWGFSGASYNCYIDVTQVE